jgi:YggT family protein
MFKLIDMIFRVYYILLAVDILASWVPEINDSKVIRAVRVFTQPYFGFFRGIIPPIGVLDISPIIAFFALQGIEWLVFRVLFS